MKKFFCKLTVSFLLLALLSFHFPVIDYENNNEIKIISMQIYGRINIGECE